MKGKMIHLGGSRGAGSAAPKNPGVIARKAGIGQHSRGQFVGTSQKAETKSCESAALPSIKHINSHEIEVLSLGAIKLDATERQAGHTLTLICGVWEGEAEKGFLQNTIGSSCCRGVGKGFFVLLLGYRTSLIRSSSWSKC